MDIIELMETPIEQIQLSTETLTKRFISSIKKNLYSVNDCCFRDIIFWGKDLKKLENIGLKCYGELKQKFNEYGIDLENENQCEKIMRQYTEQKVKKMPNAVKILDTSLEGIIPNRMYYNLKSIGYNKLYDIISEKKEILKDLLFTDRNYLLLTFAFIKYGIDINNKRQCEELIKKYSIEKEYSEKALQELKRLVDENESLEGLFTQKQRVLQEIKVQLERRKKLEQRLAECDSEYNELIEQYNLLNSKESSNNHVAK